MAENRRTDTKKLHQMVRGDLDWIVMKCLEKDRNRRYETASALAADVENYLNDEPVQACPPSAVYRFRKFSRRNKTGLTIAIVAGLAIVLVVGGAGWVLRDRATRQAALDQQIASALEESRSQFHAGKLTEAKSALTRAEKLPASGSVSTKLLESIGQWRTDLNTVNRLEQIRFEQAAQAKSFINTSHEPLVMADGAYRNVFRKYGIDPESLDIDGSARLIRESPIMHELVAALDDWFHVTDILEKTQKQRSLEGKQLLQIARLADPDPWRDRLRDAIERGDDAALSNLAAERDVVEQPPPTVLLLVRAIEAHHHNSEKAIEILRQAQLRHPSDFWINFQLANCLEEASEEEIGFLRIAIAAAARQRRSLVKSRNVFE